jgi:hypothetical protein
MPPGAGCRCCARSTARDPWTRWALPPPALQRGKCLAAAGVACWACLQFHACGCLPRCLPCAIYPRNGPGAALVRPQPRGHHRSRRHRAAGLPRRHHAALPGRGAHAQLAPGHRGGAGWVGAGQSGRVHGLGIASPNSRTAGCPPLAQNHPSQLALRAPRPAPSPPGRPAPRSHPSRTAVPRGHGGSHLLPGGGHAAHEGLWRRRHVSHARRASQP